MSTTIDQAFIKQFECCLALSETTCNRLKCFRRADNDETHGVTTVTTITLTTVFTLSSTVMHSGAKRGNEVDARGNLVALRSNFPAVYSNSRACALSNLAETHSNSLVTLC